MIGFPETHRRSALSKFFKKLADTNLLIIDDFGVRSLDKQQMLDLWN